jgi:DNA-binding SARP family transcriptional activator
MGATLELAFLGSPEIRINGQVIHVPVRKALALLAYLACEPGWHARGQLAFLFWPEKDEAGGRTSVRKILLYLNETLGQPDVPFLNASREAIAFNAACDARGDVFELESAARLARSSETPADLLDRLELIAATVRGEFMAGFGIADAFEFEDWLEGKRESVRRDLDTVLHRLARLQAGSGRLEAALATARRRVKADSLNEAAHRTVIELQLEAGDRAGAFESYRVCHDLLRQELGIPPAPETEALIRQVRANGNSTASDFAEASSGHVAVLSRAIAQPEDAAAPFVGRARELELLEQAWNKGLIAFVSGDPGSGKSRLMYEFMREFMHGSIHRQAFISLENRPGDAGVPYASLARHLRAILKAQPVTLEVWVTNELARILPEYGEAPAPIQSEQGKLRFYQAITETFQTAIRANQTLTALLYDDAQFTDTSSAEATRFVLEQLEPDARTRLRILYGYRKNELPAELETNLKQTLLTGEGLLIELEPLPASALEALLQALNLNIQPDDLSGVSRTLEQFTGGNPLFVLETVKSLTEAQHGQQWTAMDLETMRSENRLPKSSKVKQVIEQRLERLTKPARDLLRVAAVMGQEYTLERAAKVLEANQLVLAEASEELEVVGFVRQERFTHDLLFEASLENVPRAAKPLLHSRVLDVLEGQDVPAMILMRHAEGANLPKQIVHYGLYAHIDAVNIWKTELSIDILEKIRKLIADYVYKIEVISFFGQQVIVSVYSWLIKMYVLTEKFDKANDTRREYRFLSKENMEMECLALMEWSNDEFFEDAEQALKIAELTSKKQLIIQAEVNLSQNKNARGKNTREKAKFAETHMERAVKIAEEFVDSGQKFDDKLVPIGSKIEWDSPESYLISAYVDLAGRKENLNLFYEAEILLQKSMKLILNYPYNVPFVCTQSAYNKISIGKLKEAMNYAKSAISEAHVWNPPSRVWAHVPFFYIILEQGQYYQLLQEVKKVAITARIEAKSDLSIINGLTKLALGNLNAAYLTLHDVQALLLASSDWIGAENVESSLCSIALLREDWKLAYHWAKTLIAARNEDQMLNLPPMHHWHLETEALLRAGDITIARADIEARAIQVKDLNRYLIPHLRSEAVLDRHDQEIDTALEKLSRALTLAKEIGLPRETWEIEAEIAHLHDILHHTDLAAAARSRAMTIRDSLAANIPDETMNRTYLEFTQKQIDLPIWKWHANDAQT